MGHVERKMGGPGPRAPGRAGEPAKRGLEPEVEQ